MPNNLEETKKSMQSVSKVVEDEYESHTKLKFQDQNYMQKNFNLTKYQNATGYSPDNDQ